MNQIGSLLSPFFTDDEVKDYDSALTSDTKKYSEYFNFLIEQGIYVAPSQFEAMFISGAHSNMDIKTTCEVIERYFERISKNNKGV